MSVAVVITAVPVAEHPRRRGRAFEEAITPVRNEPGAELYALPEGRDRVVM
jgi:hypothetical protein